MDSLPFVSWFWLYVPITLLMIIGIITFLVERGRD